MSDIIKIDKLIPVGKQEFAYQCENNSFIFKLESHPPYHGGKEPYPNEEKDKILRYEFEMSRHTANAFSVSLRKVYQHGKHESKTELFETTMSFAQFVNQLFKGIECNIFKDM